MDSPSLPRMAERFRGFLPVVVDVETGGFDCSRHALLEIAAVPIELDGDGWYVLGETVTTHVEPFEGAQIDPKSLEITGIRLSVASPATVKAGTRIDVEVEYNTTAEEGVDIWVIPETQANMTYEGTMGRQIETGVVHKHFTIIDPCKVNSLKLLMKNASSQTVYERSMPVDYTFTA